MICYNTALLEPFSLCFFAWDVCPYRTPDVFCAHVYFCYFSFWVLFCLLLLSDAAVALPVLAGMELNDMLVPTLAALHNLGTQRFPPASPHKLTRFALGVPNARALVVRHPQLLQLPHLRATLDSLRAVGFSNVQLRRMIAWHPQLLSLHVDRKVRPVLAALREIGLSAPCDSVAAAPSLLDTALDTLRARVRSLAEMGYRDVAAMAQRCPHLLTYRCIRASVFGWFLGS